MNFSRRTGLPVITVDRSVYDAGEPVPHVGTATSRADACSRSGSSAPFPAANASRVEAQTVTERRLAVLNSPPDLIVAHNDDMSIAALEALRLTRLAHKGIKVVGFDALPSAVEKRPQGELAATVDQHGAEQVRIALRQMAGHLLGTPRRAVTVEPTLVKAANAGAGAEAAR